MGIIFYKEGNKMTEYYNDIPSQFPLGQIVMSEGVSDIFESNDDFAKFVEISLCRYASKDWGDTCEIDRKMNEKALINDGRIFAAYDQDVTIWIITEGDRSVTTILFPEEY